MFEGTTAIQVSPFNPEDREMTKAFFANIADMVVDRSELAKTVEVIRAELDQLRREIEAVREANYRMDQEIVELRSQRDEAKQESAEKGRRIGELELANANLERSNEALNRQLQEWMETMATVRNDRDTAQYRVVELEEEVGRLTGSLSDAERNAVHWQGLANACQSKLDTLRSVFRD